MGSTLASRQGVRRPQRVGVSLNPNFARRRDVHGHREGVRRDGSRRRLFFSTHHMVSSILRPSPTPTRAPRSSSRPRAWCASRSRGCRKIPAAKAALRLAQTVGHALAIDCGPSTTRPSWRRAAIAAVAGAARRRDDDAGRLRLVARARRSPSRRRGRAGAPQFGGQLFAADCAAGTPGEQSMCKNAAAAGLFHPTEMMPLVTFWDGRDWSPYSGKRSLEALAQAIMGASPRRCRPAAAMATRRRRRSARPSASVVRRRRGRRAAGVHAARLPAACRARQQHPAQTTAAARRRAAGEAVQLLHPELDGRTARRGGAAGVDRRDRLAAADGPRLEAARAAGGGASRGGRGDPRPRREHAARLRQRPGHRRRDDVPRDVREQPELRAGGEGRGGSLKLDADPAPPGGAASQELREALEAIMQPILAERITPFVRQQYAANWKQGTPIGDWSTLGGKEPLPARSSRASPPARVAASDALVADVVSLSLGSRWATTSPPAARVRPRSCELSHGGAAVAGGRPLDGAASRRERSTLASKPWRLAHVRRLNAGEWFTEAPPRGTPCARRSARRGRAPSRRRRHSPHENGVAGLLRSR